MPLDFLIFHAINALYYSVNDEIKWHHQPKQNVNMLITCMDPRIDSSHLISMLAGKTFKILSAGGLIPRQSDNHCSNTSEASSLELALEKFNCSSIVICAHSDCGAIRTKITPEAKINWPETIKWIGRCSNEPYIPYSQQPTAKEINNEAKKTALQQIGNLMTYPVVNSKVKQGRLSIDVLFLNVLTKQLDIYDAKHSKWCSARELLVSSMVARIVAAQLNQTCLNPGHIKKLPKGTALLWKTISLDIKHRLRERLQQLSITLNDNDFCAWAESGRAILSAHTPEQIQSSSYLGCFFFKPTTNDNNTTNKQPSLLARL